MTTTRTIRANVAPDSIRRVTRFFDRSIGQILTELMQNARRAGATRIDVMVGERHVSVSDDGKGFVAPDDILCFGQSRWQDPRVEREDPAGMGLYCLAGIESSIASRRKMADGSWAAGWLVKLVPATWSGEADAAVVEGNTLSGDESTRVSFKLRWSPEGAVESAKAAARHLGVDVYVAGEKTAQNAFLSEADYVRRWKGVRIGAYHPDNKSERMGKLNFHGLVMLTPAAGWLQTLAGGMGSSIDIDDCDGLKLELPARKAVIENDFFRELKQQVQRTLMLAAAAAPEPIPVRAYIRAQAARLGIELARPAELLDRWTTVDASGNRAKGAGGKVPVNGHQQPEIVLMAANLEPPDEQVLAEAARRSGLVQLAEPRMQLSGYAWYDELARVTAMTIRVDGAAGPVILRDVDNDDEPEPDVRADKITLMLAMTDNDGTERTIEVPSDVAFVSTHSADAENIGLTLSKEATISAGRLFEMIKTGQGRARRRKAAAVAANQRSWECAREIAHTRVRSLFGSRAPPPAPGPLRTLDRSLGRASEP